VWALNLFWRLLEEKAKGASFNCKVDRRVRRFLKDFISANIRKRLGGRRVSVVQVNKATERVNIKGGGGEESSIL